MRIFTGSDMGKSDIPCRAKAFDYATGRAYVWSGPICPECRKDVPSEWQSLGL